MIGLSAPVVGRVWRGLRMGCRLLLLALMISTVPAAAQKDVRQRYDIAALPFDKALARFSEISGIDVLLRPQAAGQGLSNPVKGFLTPAEALARLLAGSGLVARFTSSRSLVILPVVEAEQAAYPPGERPESGKALLSLDMMHVTAERTIGGRSDGGAAFAARMAEAIRNHVIERDLLERSSRSDMRIGARIRPNGTLYEIRIVRASRDAAADARVTAALEGARFDLVPPDNLRQPLLFDMSAR